MVVMVLTRSQEQLWGHPFAQWWQVISELDKSGDGDSGEGNGVNSSDGVNSGDGAIGSNGVNGSDGVNNSDGVIGSYIFIGREQQHNK